MRNEIGKHFDKKSMDSILIKRDVLAKKHFRATNVVIKSQSELDQNHGSTTFDWTVCEQPNLTQLQISHLKIGIMIFHELVMRTKEDNELKTYANA